MSEEILKKLNDMQNQLETIESEIEEIKEKKYDKKISQRPLNFWEFLLEVNWFEIGAVIFIILIILKKI